MMKMKAVLTPVLLVFFVSLAMVNPLYAKKLAALEGILKPSYLAVDEHQFYVIEKATVSIYSLATFKRVGSFGKQGEGPQEFALPPGGSGGMSIFPQKDTLHINSMGKISTWKKDGTFVNETRGNPMISMVQPLGKNYAGQGVIFDQKTKQVSMATNIYDLKLNKIKEIRRQDMMKAQRYRFPITIPVIFVVDGKLVTPGIKNAFSLKVFDDQGKETAHITRQYKILDVTKEYKDGILNYFKTSPYTKANYEQFKKNISFTDTFPAIQFFRGADKLIFIRTYKKQDGKDEFFIYKTDGTFVKQLYLKVYSANVFQTNPSAFKNNTFYQLVENEEEEVWELHGEKVL